MVRQAERLELIRGEVLALVALSHCDVAPALKADALAAYALAAGGAHEANAARLDLRAEPRTGIRSNEQRRVGRQGATQP